jgi:hypothetical protein
MKRFLIILSAFVLVAAASLSGLAHAATNYNDIIDDPVFDNSGAMSAAQIDAFLNSFPSSCISTNNGFSAPDPTGYTPASGFQYGGNVSAGTVIAHAAQGYGINPQVILATLQKEQGLVVGDGGNVVRNGTDCGALAISASMGYNCPDTQVLTSYSGFELYAHNGVPVTSVSNTCVRKASYVGFTRQVIIAAWQFTFDRHRSEGQNNWYDNRPGWDNSDDLGFCYSGHDAAGGPYYLCPDQDSHASDPYVAHSGQYAIDGTVVTIQNGATAAFYNYTPHLHGQDLFTQFFTTWFGSPYSHCTYPTDNSGGVYREFNPNTNSYFLTTDPGEVCVVTGNMGYTNDGVAFYPAANTESPVYRLRRGSNYLYTASQAESNSAVQQYGFTLEGVAFYADTSATAGNPDPVYRLSYHPTGGYAYTMSTAERDMLINNLGYSDEGTAFYVNNTSGNSLSNIYRLRGPSSGYLYTASTAEASSAQAVYGFTSEGVAFQTRLGFSVDSLPVYRLAGSHGYLFTTSLSERKAAFIAGYRSEGVGFFAYPTSNLGASQQVSRLNHNGSYLFTSSASEASSAQQNYGYVLEGQAFRTP